MSWERACEMLLIPATATLGILSDIDDTVIRSRSGNKLKMAQLVLPQRAGEREVVPGAPELYRALVGGASGGDGNPVFYHSSASWDTYEHIHRFLEENRMPRGPMFLRQYTAESLIAGSDVEHKRTAMEEVLGAFPRLPFLLLGDAAGDDPEAYLEVVRRHGDRIRAESGSSNH